LYATVQPTSVENFYQNYNALVESGAGHPVLIAAMQQFVINMQPEPCKGTDSLQGCLVFTDDLAPIEWITNSLVLNYVLFGDMEGLQ
jgi:hypothetical protein